MQVQVGVERPAAVTVGHLPQSLHNDASLLRDASLYLKDLPIAVVSVSTGDRRCWQQGEDGDVFQACRFLIWGYLPRVLAGRVITS